METPPNLYKCWYIDDAQRLIALRTGKPFDRVYSTDYFEIVNRIDSIFIEGYIARKEDNGKYTYVNDIRDNLTYLIDFQNKKKVYFSFDSINLYEMIEFLPSAPNPIKFILRRLDYVKNVKHEQAFMIMPFKDDKLNQFYKDQIKPFLKKELNIEIYRADDILDNDIIVDTIYRLLEESEFIIAETTNNNKNAFYELGYAAARNKEIITIQHGPSQKELFFDRSHIRSIMYDDKDIPSFHFNLRSTIQSIRARM